MPRRSRGDVGPITRTEPQNPAGSLVPVPLVVQKFGGTSVSDPDRMREVADHVARTRRRGDDVVVVVSAMGKETDELLHLASQVSSSPRGREVDMLITAGERKAMALLAMALEDAGCPAASFTGSQAGILTDVAHQKARIVDMRVQRLKEALAAGRTPVVGGAQGVSTEGDVTFLGRNGSDVTAVALANALDADACELYTDVSGVFTADPRVVSGARRLSKVLFDEMLEMCASGCPKPAMRAVEFARTHGVRLHVRSAFTWEPGTWIEQEDKTLEQPIISAVIHDVSEAKVTVTRVPDHPGVAAALFRSLADHNINVDMIVQNSALDGTTDITFTVPRADLATGLSVCQAHVGDLGGGQVLADPDIAKVSLIGAGMKSNPGVAATMFEVLAKEQVNIEMISTSPIRISCVVRAGKVEDAVQALHAAFGLEAG
jgi:aspartate kinase